VAGRPTIYIGRTWAFNVTRYAADGVTLTEWPAGTYTSQIRKRRSTDSPVLATVTVDVSDIAVVDGATIVLRLTDEQTALLEKGDVWCDVETDASGVVDTALSPFRVSIVQGVTDS
jgi:hypothetical protein